MYKKDREKIFEIKRNLIPIDIRHKAEKMGISPYHLAEKLSVSTTIIYNAYNGKAPLALGRIHEYCTQLSKKHNYNIGTQA